MYLYDNKWNCADIYLKQSLVPAEDAIAAKVIYQAERLLILGHLSTDTCMLSDISAHIRYLNLKYCYFPGTNNFWFHENRQFLLSNMKDKEANIAKYCQIWKSKLMQFQSLFSLSGDQTLLDMG